MEIGEYIQYIDVGLIKERIKKNGSVLLVGGEKKRLAHSFVCKLVPCLVPSNKPGTGGVLQLASRGMQQ